MHQNRKSLNFYLDSCQGVTAAGSSSIEVGVHDQPILHHSNTPTLLCLNPPEDEDEENEDEDDEAGPCFTVGEIGSSLVTHGTGRCQQHVQLVVHRR